MNHQPRFFLPLCLYLTAIVTLSRAASFPNGPIVMNELSKGVEFQSTIAPTASIDDAYIFGAYHKIWIPDNAKSINFTYARRTEDCYYIDFFTTFSSVPCSNRISKTNIDYLRCQDNMISSAGSFEEFKEISVGTTRAQTVGWFPGNWFYITAVRGTAGDFNQTCSYRIRVDYQTCADGEVALYQGGAGAETPLCVPLSRTINDTATLRTSVDLPSFSTAYQIMKVRIPPWSSALNISVTTSSPVYGIFIHSFSPAFRNNYGQRDLTATTVGQSYLYQMLTPPPVEGWMWLTIENNSSTPYSTYLEIIYTVCANNTVGGISCGDNVTYHNSSFSEIAQLVSSIPKYRYEYIDVPYGATEYWEFFVKNIANAGYFIYRRNGFPTNNAYDYQTIMYNSYSARYILTPGDTYIGGKFIFVQIPQSGTYTYNLTITKNSVAPPPSSSSSSTISSSSTAGSSTSSNTNTNTNGNGSGSDSGDSSSPNTDTFTDDDNNSASATMAVIQQVIVVVALLCLVNFH